MSSTSKTGSISMAKGFRAAGVTCGIKSSGQPDLAMILAEKPCVAAGVFTQNSIVGAPVIVGKGHLSDGLLQGIICNSGNANAATGDQGLENARQMCILTSQALNASKELGLMKMPRTSEDLIAPASTGVIGVQLPMDKVRKGIFELVSKLKRGPEADLAAATAILTTDLVSKQAHRTIKIGKKTVRIGGIAKGSGMIEPNMATMLSFITTDADITADLLHQALKDAADVSFNCISVDHHPSPSDMLIAMASGLAGHKQINTDKRNYQLFADALADLCSDLAFQVVKDGEGAEKVFRVLIRGAKSKVHADRVGRAVVNSPLVKTAVHGGDPNWGRIITAAGASGATIKPSSLSLSVGPKQEVCVFSKGEPCVLDGPMERRLERLMADELVVFSLDLGLGDGEAQWHGCDLSAEYVTINAEYTT